jgi:hypothetical protein
VDYLGEPCWEDYAHRFQGFSRNFSLALHGPAEQAVQLLKDLHSKSWQKIPGLLYPHDKGRIARNPKSAWNPQFLKKTNWDNIYRVGEAGLAPLKITTGQVLQQIGCPHAAAQRVTEIDYPASVPGKSGQKIRIPLKGCSFCDVATDKGFYGALNTETVLAQIRSLPDGDGGRKIPFELINENALSDLPHLLTAVGKRGIRLSQLNLTLRADWFLRGKDKLRDALRLAGAAGVRILLASVGFESFDDTILRNLNKGLDVETNLQAIGLMRRLKEEFPRQWAYSRAEGGQHGFIHPTPWDTDETASNIQRCIDRYALDEDILPHHSIPLIIHHASRLGDWIRKIETREACQFRRLGTIIEWWHLERNGSG